MEGTHSYWTRHSQPYRQGKHQEHLWASGRWDMRSERPLLIPACHRSPQDNMSASSPHSVQLWPDPPAHRAPRRASDNCLYVHLQGLSRTAGGHTDRYHSVTPHQSARCSRWAHYHHSSHTGISSPHLCPRLRHTLGICNGMAGSGSSVFKRLPQAPSHKRK